MLNRFDEAKMWLDKAILEAPYLRDPYMERALLEYKLENWKEVEKYTLEALNIKYHQKTYINEIFSWDKTPYDLLSLSYYYQGKYEEALKNANIALSMQPNDLRLKNNIEIIKSNIWLVYLLYII